MARGGIYDQLGGGFHRYSIDAHWLVPHFEKMLYDNALLARPISTPGRSPASRLPQVVEETLDYVLRDMTAPEGGFYCAQDADSEGEEGKFFVWTPDEIWRCWDRTTACSSTPISTSPRAAISRKAATAPTFCTPTMIWRMPPVS